MSGFDYAPDDDHPIVADRVADGTNPPDDIVFAGLPKANCPEKGFTRLFLAMDFSVWIDIDNSTITHTEYPSDDERLTPAVLWVQRDAKIVRGSRRSSVAYLEGDVFRAARGSAWAWNPSGLGWRPDQYCSGTHTSPTG